MSGSPSSAAPRYIPIDRKQLRLESLDVERLIDDDHAARKLWRVVEQLDLSLFESEVRAVEGVAGRPPHSPQVLVAVWLYAFSKGLHSAREVERQMHHEPGFRWLTGLHVINHHSLSDFRVGYGEALRELFEQVLAMLTMKGLITLERVAVDGTKIRADAGKKSFSKRAKMEAHLALAREHLGELERQERDEHATQREQAARRRAARKREQRLAEALQEIERLRAAKKDGKNKEPQASLSDPWAAFMWLHEGGLAPAYNVQVTADSAHGLIADILVVNDPQDGHQIAPAMDRLRARDGRYPQQALADGAYTNLASVMEMHERAIDYYSTWTGRTATAAGRGAERHADYLEQAGAFRVRCDDERAQLSPGPAPGLQPHDQDEGARDPPLPGCGAGLRPVSGAPVVLSEAELEQRRALAVVHESRSGDRSVRSENGAAGGAGDLQETGAAGGVSERLDQDEGEAEAVCDARARAGAMRSDVGGATRTAELRARRNGGGSNRGQFPAGADAGPARAARRLHRRPAIPSKTWLVPNPSF